MDEHRSQDAETEWTARVTESGVLIVKAQSWHESTCVVCSTLIVRGDSLAVLDNAIVHAGCADARTLAAE
jgi:hypothetical protein